MKPADAQQVLAIYREGIEDRTAIFETESPDWRQFDANHVESCRLVAEAGGRLVGWGVLAPVSNRTCYAGVAEVSVYVTRDWRGVSARDAMLALVDISSTTLTWKLLFQHAALPQDGFYVLNVGHIQLISTDANGRLATKTLAYDRCKDCARTSK